MLATVVLQFLEARFELAVSVYPVAADQVHSSRPDLEVGPGSMTNPANTGLFWLQIAQRHWACVNTPFTSLHYASDQSSAWHAEA